MLQDLEARTIELKEELQHQNKGHILVNDYVFHVKVMCDELQFVGYTITEEEKLMYVLRALDENCYSVFSRMIEKMITEH